MSLFKTKKFDLGDVNREDVKTWRFDLSDNVNLPIEYVQTGCSCTQMNGLKDGYIEGTLNIKMSSYDRETGKIYRTITACLKDGQPEYIADAKGKRIVNPNKKRETLVIEGSVNL